MKMKKAFTLLELMVVLAIIGILLGIVMAVASSSIQWARDSKARALCKVVQSGIEEYKAQKDKWPHIDDQLSNLTSSNRTNKDGYKEEHDAARYHLTAEEVRNVIRTVIEDSVKDSSPMMDFSKLYVSRSPGNAGSEAYGYDFWDAVKGAKKRSPMDINEMYFGYPETYNGYFRSFRIVYSIPTDSLEVTRQ